VFCPECRAEYRDGFHVCADCNVELVDELPPLQKPEYIEYEEVLGTYNAADIALLKSILDVEGLTYYFLGEHFMYVRPLADPARLMVKKDEVQKALDAIEGLELSYMAINLSKKEDQSSA